MRNVLVEYDDFVQDLVPVGDVWTVTGTDEETGDRVTFTSPADAVSDVVEYVMDTGEAWRASVEESQVTRVETLEDRAREQERRHEVAPYAEPKYLPADEPGFETEAWTAGGPEEEDA
jgi:hypothetical protein